MLGSWNFDIYFNSNLKKISSFGSNLNQILVICIQFNLCKQALSEGTKIPEGAEA